MNEAKLVNMANQIATDSEGARATTRMRCSEGLARPRRQTQVPVAHRISTLATEPNAIAIQTEAGQSNNIVGGDGQARFD